MRMLLNEVWRRSIDSYQLAMEQYQIRIENNVQPKTPFIDLFDVTVQYSTMIWANVFYLSITMLLYFFMRRRKIGFRMRWVLVCYDALNALLAAYIAIRIIIYKVNSQRSFICNDLNNDEEGKSMAFVFALFYVQKYFECFDTWLFILRKSFRQVTFLHLFHHSSISVVVGSIMPFDYNGDMYLPILLNSINHALIYTHYLFATLGMETVWSSYLTSAQFLQFVLIFLQSLFAYQMSTNEPCGSPDFAKVLLLVYMGSMIFLCANYFIQKYLLGSGGAALDYYLCGVVKRPQLSLLSTLHCSYCGVLQLDNQGSCVVVLPDDFPDEEKIRKESDDAVTLLIHYSITALRHSMPGLHIAREVSRTAAIRSKAFKMSTAAKLSGEGLSSRAGNDEDGNSTKLLVSTGELSSSSCAESHGGKTKSTAVNSRQGQVRGGWVLDGGVPKASSFSDFQNIHNDRLIDNPRPYFNSNKTPTTTLATSPSFTSLLQNSSNRKLSSSDVQKASSTESGGDVKASDSVIAAAGVDNEERQSTVPLSFEVAGGAPGGRVSWSIRVIPRRRLSRHRKQIALQMKHGQQEDWRAISQY